MVKILWVDSSMANGEGNVPSEKNFSKYKSIRALSRELDIGYINIIDDLVPRGFHG